MLSKASSASVAFFVEVDSAGLEVPLAGIEILRQSGLVRDHVARVPLAPLGPIRGREDARREGEQEDGRPGRRQRGLLHGVRLQGEGRLIFRP